MRLSRTATPKAGASRRARGRAFTSPIARPLPLTGLAAVVLALALGTGFGLPGLASDDTGTAHDLRPLLRESGSLVVYSEFAETADTIWAANPADPSARAKLGEVEHAAGWGIMPALSPDGRYVAYTVLQADLPRPGPGALAELWVLDVAGGGSHRLAEGLDILLPPLWTPAGDAVIVRSGEWNEDGGASFRIVRVSLDGDAVPLAQAEADLFPVDFSPDGAWFYYASLSQNGTDLMRVPAVGTTDPEAAAHLSDGVARDWQLSRDGTKLAYLAQADVDASVAFTLRVLDLETGQAETPRATAEAATFSPLWDRSGRLIFGRLGGRLDAAGLPARVLDLSGEADSPSAEFPAPPDGAGFDLPLSFSPDGEHLAVRAFTGSSLAEPGPSYVELVGADGARRRLADIADVIIAGWLEAAP